MQLNADLGLRSGVSAAGLGSFGSRFELGRAGS